MKTTLALPRLSPRPPLLSRLFTALTTQKTRRDLAALEPHILRDIGLTPDQARREAARPIWDAPETWRRGE